MSQRLYVGPQASATLLDLMEDIPIPVTISVSDVRDADKGKGAPYSEKLILPETKTNSEFFGGIYDINSDSTIFNPNVKTECIFYNNDDVILEGYLQLVQVQTNDLGYTTYECTIFDSAGDFWSKTDKLKVNELDLSDLEHTLNRTNIKDSWSMEWDGDGGTGNADLTRGGIYYGFLNNAKQTQAVEDFKFSIFYKTLLDKIVTEAGYTWSGDLFDSARFEREVIPYAGDVPAISDSVASAKTFEVDRATKFNINLTTSTVGVVSQVENSLEFDNEVSDPNNLFLTDTFTASDAGLYAIQYDLDIDYTIDYIRRSTFLGNIEDNTKIELVAKFYNASATLVDTEVIVLDPGPHVFSMTGAVASSQSEVFNILQSGYIPGDATATKRYMGVNWYMELYIRTEATQATFQNTSNLVPDTVCEFSDKNIDVQVGSSLESVYILYSITEGDTIKPAELIEDKYKQKDLLRDLKTRYNLYIYTNPEDPNDIVFDFRDEFYQAGPVRELTGKRDESQRTQIKLIGDLQSEKIELTYKPYNDIYNETYTDSSGGDVYGEFEYLFGNEFVKGDKKIETPFHPTPMINHDGLGYPVPAIDSYAPKCGLRVLYANNGLYTKSGITIEWDLEYRDGSGVIQTETITGYPYIGHYDDPYNPTYTLNFGQVNPLMYQGIEELPNDTHYERYWKNTLIQLADGKLETDMWALTSEDIDFFRRNPNAKVYDESTKAYYYINKISYEGNTNLKKLSKMELIPVQDDLTVDTSTETATGAGDNGEITLYVPPRTRSTSVGSNVKTWTANGELNSIGSNSTDIAIIGDSNEVLPNSTNVSIYGNDNKVKGDNLIVIGDGGDIEDSNAIYINGVNISDNNSERLDLESDAVTSLDLSKYKYFEIAITQDFKLDYHNEPDSTEGSEYVITFVQGSTARSVSFEAGKFGWSSSNVASVPTVANEVTQMRAYWDGEKLILTTEDDIIYN